jgi:hypothetical protein
MMRPFVAEGENHDRLPVRVLCKGPHAGKSDRCSFSEPGRVTETEGRNGAATSGLSWFLGRVEAPPEPATIGSGGASLDETSVQTRTGEARRVLAVPDFEGARNRGPTPASYLSRGPAFMKRFGVLLAGVFVGSWIAGCDGGLKEGPPPEPVKSGQTAEFKELMQKNSEQMQKQTKPKNPPKAGP